MMKHQSILVVDDDRELLKVLSRTLELEGYDAVLAADGRSAMVLLEKYGPDLVILDIMMPKLDGFQVLDLIRQRSNVPVIMLTARCEVTSLRDAIVLGADDYVRKPFHTRELLARIKAKLRRARLGSCAISTTDTTDTRNGVMAKKCNLSPQLQKDTMGNDRISYKNSEVREQRQW